MIKVYYLKKEYYRLLSIDKEFCIKINRPYFLINKIKYKSKTISVAIPLRSNINIRFQKNKLGYIKVINNKHTLSYKGYVAGWHILKFIPTKRELMYASKTNNKEIIEAMKIIKRNNSKEAINKCNILIKKLEKGNKVYGVINFDYYVNLLYK